MQAAYTSGMKTKFLGMLTLLFAPIYLFLVAYNDRTMINFLALGIMVVLAVVGISKAIEMIYEGCSSDSSTNNISKLGLALCIGLSIYFVMTRDVAMTCSIVILGITPLILTITTKQ